MDPTPLSALRVGETLHLFHILQSEANIELLSPTSSQQFPQPIVFFNLGIYIRYKTFITYIIQFILASFYQNLQV